MGETTISTPKQKPIIKRAERRPFAAIVNDLRSWATMYHDVLTKVGGSDPSLFLQGQLNVLDDMISKLGPKDGK